jgi:hypothetical protein
VSRFKLWVRHIAKSNGSWDDMQRTLEKDLKQDVAAEVKNETQSELFEGSYKLIFSAGQTFSTLQIEDIRAQRPSTCVGITPNVPLRDHLVMRRLVVSDVTVCFKLSNACPYSLDQFPVLPLNDRQCMKSNFPTSGKSQFCSKSST